MPDFPFKSDGCSGGMTWLWLRFTGKSPPWEGLCREHDVAYHLGGTVEKRRAADRNLMAGVVMNGHPIWAFAIWVGVRIGGVPWLPTSWRWGFGWKDRRGYDR